MVFPVGRGVRRTGTDHHGGCEQRHAEDRTGDPAKRTIESHEAMRPRPGRHVKARIWAVVAEETD
jgi:hypothetical protein